MNLREHGISEVIQTPELTDPRYDQIVLEVHKKKGMQAFFKRNQSETSHVTLGL